MRTNLLNLNRLIKEKEKKYHCLYKLEKQIYDIVPPKEYDYENIIGIRGFNNLILSLNNLIIRFLYIYDIEAFGKLVDAEEILSPILKGIKISKKTIYVGFSINYIQQLFFTIIIINYLKTKFSHLKIIIGGNLVTHGYIRLIGFLEKKDTPPG